MVDKDQYERDLAKRQKEHLDRVYNRGMPFQPCAHNACSECHGTGIKGNGAVCVHMLSCSCPKCSPYCMSM